MSAAEIVVKLSVLSVALPLLVTSDNAQAVIQVMSCVSTRLKALVMGRLTETRQRNNKHAYLEELIMAAGRHVILDGGVLHEELPSADQVGVHCVWRYLIASDGLLLRVIQEHDAHHPCSHAVQASERRCL